MKIKIASNKNITFLFQNVTYLRTASLSNVKLQNSNYCPVEGRNMLFWWNSYKEKGKKEPFYLLGKERGNKEISGVLYELINLYTENDMKENITSWGLSTVPLMLTTESYFFTHCVAQHYTGQRKHACGSHVAHGSLICRSFIAPADLVF